MMIFCCFKEKTSYELRISDWSSDVCASDLSHDRKWHEPHPDASRQNDTPATSTEHSRQKRCAPAACESQWPPPTVWPDHCEKIPAHSQAGNCPPVQNGYRPHPEKPA